ncbi:hypothetical protein [uncultured Methanobrevibacter sp.]|uniref:hypothetical protein n=1 Tax=uncultured Methanobrevibacter sp. TaxID=253161 RepID=UPI0025CC75E1|nr:hypothetical protein [uncultured Methanobrevibacter sp.]
MEFKEYFNLIYIVIVLCVILIIYFSMNAGFLFIEIYHNETLTIQSKLDTVSIYSSLIVVLVSIISISITTKYARDSLNQTNELIEENKKDLFIQLRFDGTKRGVDKLIKYLESTFGVYNQLVNLYNSDNPEKDKYLSPRAFLVLQYVNIISNEELLFELPDSLKTNIESGFINFNDESILTRIYDYSNFNELLKKYGFVDDYHKYFSIITSKNPPTKVIQNYISYQSCINEFNAEKDYELQESVFRYYYGFKKITVEDFYNFYVDIYNDLKFHTTEELILRDFKF